jgi:hypothetical protein
MSTCVWLADKYTDLKHSGYGQQPGRLQSLLYAVSVFDGLEHKKGDNAGSCVSAARLWLCMCSVRLLSAAAAANACHTHALSLCKDKHVQGVMLTS